MSLRSFLKANCKPLYCILYGKRQDTWRKTRMCGSVAVGSLCAWLICKFIFKSFLIPKKYENVILLVGISAVAGGFLLTDAVKCITLMIFVCLLGKSGRSYMRALSFAFVISGPIENLSSNAGEVVRTFSCSKIMAINLTRTRFDLMIKPFQQTLVHMKDDIKDIQATFNELKNVTSDLHKEVMLEDQDQQSENVSLRVTEAYTRQLNANNVENRYKNKFKKRCFQQLENGRVRCEEAFSDALKKCYDKMPFILKTLICWPFKVDFLCKMNLLGNKEKICDPSDAVPNNFGESYIELVATENELYEGSSKVKVNYTILGSEEIPGVKSAQETAKNIGNQFRIKKQIFDSILKVLEQFLAFMILKILYVCIKYHKMYRADLDHDNIYITDYFKHVDGRRKAEGKQSLVPLKKYERRNLIDVDQLWHRTQEESRAITYHLLQFSLEIVTCCFFLFLDYVVVSVLYIIRRNSEVAFVQEGEHTIHFEIQGTGLIARLLRNTMGYFNMHETVSTYLTNEVCLPVPKTLPESFYLKLLALYIFVLFIIYQSSRFLRMRRVICAYFYHKREKRRILYLYNSLLKQRRTLRETMKREVKYNFANRRIRSKANLFLILRLKWPQHFNWLVKFNMGRRKCVICGELEDSNFVLCRNGRCNASYCNECFEDIENNCWVCNNVLAVEILLNFNDFFEEISPV